MSMLTTFDHYRIPRLPCIWVIIRLLLDRAGFGVASWPLVQRIYVPENTAIARIH